MRYQTPVLLLSIALLTAPGALAHTAHGAADADTGSMECSGSIDFACLHTECPSPVFCVRLVCAVYIGHSGHTNPTGMGCTPP